MQYSEFIKSKAISIAGTGIEYEVNLNDRLFHYQKDIVKWALRKGRAAIFADCGMGKSLMQLEWANHVHRHTNKPVIILAPLAVASQTVNEGRKFGIDVNLCRDQSDFKDGINILNYEIIHKFDLSNIGGVVLDESSILKASNGKTRNLLIDTFKHTQFKLACSATPSPNDYMELGSHSEFLGILNHSEMLAMYFIHDGGDTSKWRLKGHGKDKFWHWVCEWAIMITKPSDLGYSDDGFVLPALNYIDHRIAVDAATDGNMFAMPAESLSERIRARRDSVEDRVKACFLFVTSSFCDKLSESQNDGDDYGLEKRISREQNSKGTSESRTKSNKDKEREGKSRKDKRTEVTIHEGVSPEKHREMEENSRTKEHCKREKKGEICNRCRIQRASKAKIKGVLELESTEEKGATSGCVWANNRKIRQDDGIAESSMCDLRILGYETKENVSNDRSLPFNGNCQGNTLLELQYGIGEIQGQNRSIGVSNSISEKKRWLIWCNLNSEQDALEKLFGDLCFSVQGSNTSEQKEKSIYGWLNGDRPIMISKVSVMGFGLNLQCCHNVAFVGLSDSYEQFYQAIRRCWRFGQTEAVNAHLFFAETEGNVLQNIKRKDADCKKMAKGMIEAMTSKGISNVQGTKRTGVIYNAQSDIVLPSWLTNTTP